MRSSLDARRKEREISASPDSESFPPDKRWYLLNGSYVFQKVLKVSPVYEEVIIKKKKKTSKKSKRSRSNSDSESDSKKDDLRLRLDARRKKRKLSANKNIKTEIIEEEPEKKPKIVKEDDTAG